MTALEQAAGFATVARVGDVEPGTVRVIELEGGKVVRDQSRGVYSYSH